MSFVWSGAKANTRYRYCIYSAVSAARSQPAHFLYTLPLFSASSWALNNLILCWLTVSVTQKPVRVCPDCHFVPVMWDYLWFWPSIRAVAAVFQRWNSISKDTDVWKIRLCNMIISCRFIFFPSSRRRILNYVFRLSLEALFTSHKRRCVQKQLIRKERAWDVCLKVCMHLTDNDKFRQ